MQEDRRLTLIVVPHGDLETRSVEVSYRKVRLVLILGLVLVLLFGFLVATWFPVAAQAGRVPALERELVQLEQERATVAELARTLADVEAQYERVRELLGADAAAPGETGPLLPPLRPEGVAADSTASPDPRSDSVPEEEEEEEVGEEPDAWPLARAGRITRPLETGEDQHPGLDIAAAMNSNVRAAGAGVVAEAGESEEYGRFVRIRHGGGIESLYGHVSRLYVEEGDHVGRREVIALTGSAGGSAAPYLHFEIRRDGKPVDPLRFVNRPGS